ncbi:MAG: Bug family tripartite tricarboxylate transporter substrate binding protein [Sphaerochaeta sp.]|jgi:putative tricarboxylic transport membrane protein|uniref:Bug family tripartite tricarboxylate transporter substrate binding protein n=1 Tax=Sphaerochaeta sp. TaxID=1972642 RepID=UPI002FC80011
MKKVAILLTMVLLVSMAVFANGTTEATGAAKTFVPTKNIDWYVTSSPGGGSDIFTRQIMDIAVAENLLNGQNIVVQYKTDGAGEVGRLLVSQIKAGVQADHTLLTFNSGDLMPMVKNTNNRFQNFQPIAHMAVDKHLIFVGEQSKYKSFEEVLAALKNGERMVLAGSKGDDIACHAALIKELGVSEDQLSYVAHDATSGAITGILGGHFDLLISKPAAASQYVEAGKLKPILALSTSRFPGNLNSAPTLSEFGYKNVEVPNWRSVVAPASMSPEAVAYWTDVMKKVSESDAWQNGYIAKQKLVPDFMDSETFKAYGTKYQADYLASIGKDK